MRLRSKKNYKVRCDKCGRTIQNIKPRTKRNGEIEHSYFRCKHCAAVYVVSVTDEKLRERIRVYAEMAEKAIEQQATPEQLRQQKEFLEENVRLSRELAEKYPIELKAWER